MEVFVLSKVTHASYATTDPSQHNFPPLALQSMAMLSRTCISSGD